MNSPLTRKTVLALVSLVGAIGISTATASVTSAGCTGQHYSATANGQTFIGTCGNDTFEVHQYSNITIKAGAGDDEIKVGWGGGKVYVEGGDGDDSVWNGGEKQVELYGQGGNDTLEGGPFNDVIFGGGGNDKIEGGNGKDVLWGDGGNDYINADSYGTLQAAQIDGGPGTDTARLDKSIDKWMNVETVSEGFLG